MWISLSVSLDDSRYCHSSVSLDFRFLSSSDSLDTLSISLTSDSLGQSVVERQSRGPVSCQATVLAPLSSYSLGPLSSYILDVQFPCQASVLAPVLSSVSLGPRSCQATVLAHSLLVKRQS